MHFVQDPDHWLHRLSPREWISAASGELAQAERAFASRDGRGGLAGAKRAAGMALNGVLRIVPDERWGRTYVEHMAGVSKDETAPRAVREAASALLGATPPGGSLLSIHSRGSDQRLIDAARTVLAHAYTVVLRTEDEQPAPAPPSQEPSP